MRFINISFGDFTDYLLIIHVLFVFNGVHEVTALSFTDFDFGISPIEFQGNIQNDSMI